MANNLSISAVKAFGSKVKFQRNEQQPVIPPDSQLIAVLKTNGKGTETEFAVDVTSQGMYETALCSLIARINSDMELYQLSRADLEKCAAVDSIST